MQVAALTPRQSCVLVYAQHLAPSSWMDTATSKQLASVSAWSSILWQGAGFRSCHGSRRCAGEDSGSWPKKQPNDLRVAREKDQKYGNREITRESSEPRLKKNKSWAGGGALLVTRIFQDSRKLSSYRGAGSCTAGCNIGLGQKQEDLIPKACRTVTLENATNGCSCFLLLWLLATEQQGQWPATREFASLCFHLSWAQEAEGQLLWLLQLCLHLFINFIIGGWGI